MDKEFGSYYCNLLQLLISETPLCVELGRSQSLQSELYATINISPLNCHGLGSIYGGLNHYLKLI